MHKSRQVGPKRSLLRRLVRIVGRVLLTILVIVLILFFLIQTPFVQNMVQGKAEVYLSRKLKTRELKKCLGPAVGGGRGDAAGPQDLDDRPIGGRKGRSP